ncbi:hypothetical protein K505DRAFT_245462, partial [Melanomma pulvis-pyrius CBS 109.77]
PEADDPPAYALLDSTQTSFTIHGTFIHTPNGPCYQLSSPLDQRGPYFRVRRLGAKEAAQVGVAPISFDRGATLYEVNDPPLLDNEYHMQGKRRSCLPGVLEIKYRSARGRWEVRHVARSGSGARGVEVLTRKCVGGGGRFGGKGLDRRRERGVSEWKDAQGRVVATEVVKGGEGEGEGVLVPTIELSGELDQTWREVVLCLWAARLWVAFGVEKTAMMGGRYGDTRLVR